MYEQVDQYKKQLYMKQWNHLADRIRYAELKRTRGIKYGLEKLLEQQQQLCDRLHADGLSIVCDSTGRAVTVIHE